MHLFITHILLYYRYCCSCSPKLRKDSKFCCCCQADQTKVGPPNFDSENGAIHLETHNPITEPGSSQAQSFGRCLKAMSLEGFCERKSMDRLTGLKPPPKKKKKGEDDVSIFIGRKQWSNDKLKTMWSKRLHVTVPKNATCALIWKRRQRNRRPFIAISMTELNMYCCMMMEDMHNLCLEATNNFLIYLNAEMKLVRILNELHCFCVV